MIKKSSNKEFQELPDSWKVVKLGDVIDIQGGSQPPKKHFVYEPREGYVRLLQIRDFGDKPAPTYVPKDMVTKFCTKEDIFIARYGASLGRIITGMEGAYNVALAKVIFDKETFFSKYFFYLLQTSYFQTPIHMISRSAQNGFNKGEIFPIEIPMAPITEQKRIVAEIEKQFSRLDEAVDNLKRVKANLKRYKASVLKGAVEGKLTEEWREKHPGVEPADKFLERILAERRKKWEEAELVKMKSKGKVPQDNNWKKKYKGPDNPKIIDLPLLPDGWIWVNIDQIILLLTDYHANGSYKILKQNVEILDPDNYAIYVRATNLEKNNFKTNLKYVTKKAHMFLKKSEVFGNEIIIGKIGNAGKVYFMPKLDRPCTLGMNLFMLRFSWLTVFRYIYYHLISFFSENEIKSKVKGVGNPSIDKKAIRSLRIALPPIEEQKELLKLVDEKISLISNLEFELIKHLSRAERLRQSILKKAFSGKLVY